MPNYKAPVQKQVTQLQVNGAFCVLGRVWALFVNCGCKSKIKILLIIMDISQSIKRHIWLIYRRWLCFDNSGVCCWGERPKDRNENVFEGVSSMAAETGNLSLSLRWTIYKSSGS